MADLHVSLPDALHRWAESRVAEGGYGSTDDYVRDLMLRDREQSEKLARLQAAIEEGRASGISEQEPFAYIERLRAGLRGSADAA